MFSVLLVLCYLVLLEYIVATGQVNNKTNFVIFFADDFGWGDLASFGHPTQEHGRLDELAEKGVRFTQWYSAESVCTPSRMGLLTGRLPTRMGMAHTVFSPQGSQALPLTDPTLAEMLQPYGYRSSVVGKWHLGINNVSRDDGLHLPFYRGFKFTGHILPFSNHWACDESGRHSPKPGMDPATDAVRNSTCFIYHNTTLVQQPIDHSTLTDTLVADATDFISASVAVKAPFFLYFPFPQCHVSMFTNTSFTNTSVNGIFGDQIREMDWAAGQVLDALENAGVSDNTLVFFTSDNGPHIELCAEGGTAAGLRGGKGDSSWEGGLRMPAIISWPGHLQVPEGSVLDTVASTLDISATILDIAAQEAAGHALSKDPYINIGQNSSYPYPDNGHVYDGRSLLPILLGQNVSHGPHDKDGLFHYCGDTLMAVRLGEYKLKYYSEQLPFDNYSDVHCTAGWAHGEFFQGGWACHDGSVETLNPPHLIRITSDFAERYNLLQNSTWTKHLQWLLDDPIVTKNNILMENTLQVTPNLRKLDYFDRLLGHNVCPAILNGSTNASSYTTLTDYALEGYSGTAPFPQNATGAQQFDMCAKHCCLDQRCAAFIFQPSSKNKGIPSGSCVIGKPCCWLVDTEHAGELPFADQNAVIGYPRGDAPPGPAPPGPAPPGPYENLLKEFSTVLANHLAQMKRESIPSGHEGNLSPCCTDFEEDRSVSRAVTGTSETCTCGYPGRLTRRTNIGLSVEGQTHNSK